jgi:glycosyltransferase domain-containing protein
VNPDHELTILLALKDRFPFTVRWMSYGERVRLPFAVFIADGSEGDDGERLLAGGASFPGVRYQYVRYGRDATYTDYWRKVADACTRIQTPFVALADNDDFFLVPGVRDAVRFLGGPSEFVTCGGQCAVFWVESEGPGTETRDAEALYGSRVAWKSSVEARSLQDESARERIRGLSLNAAHPAYYHVRRTAELRRLAEIVRDADLRDPFLVERLVLFLTAIAGKTRQLDTLYLARQWNAPGSSGLAHEREHGDWFGRMLASTWSRDFTTFVDVASRALAARDGLAEDEARRAIVELYRLWLAPQMLGDVLAEPTVTWPMAMTVGVVRRLLARSPDSPARRLARMVYRRSRWISLDAVHGTQLRARRVPDAADAFRPIYQFLTAGEAAAGHHYSDP